MLRAQDCRESDRLGVYLRERTKGFCNELGGRCAHEGQRTIRADSQGPDLSNQVDDNAIFQEEEEKGWAHLGR